MSYPQNFGGKFGLVLAPGLAKKKQAAVAAAARRPTGLSVFGADDLDEGPAAAAVNAEVLRHQAQAAKQTAAHVESVDESVYDYDSFLDGEAEAKKARASAAAREAAVKPVRESKYISSLLSQAKQRELERERIYERKLVKERMEDDKEHGDKPMLVTEGYKRKLEEQRKREAEEAVLEARNGDVTKKKDLTGFYRHLLGELADEGGAPAPVAEPPKIASPIHEPPRPSTPPLGPTLPPAAAPTVRVLTEAANSASQAPTVTEAPTQAPSVLPSTAPPAPPQLSKEEIIAAAKERAAARKRARTEAPPPPV